MASKITMKKQGWLDIDVQRIADAAVAAAIGAVLNRQHDSLDVHDQPFKPYSAAYAAKLVRDGESTKVDHRVSGLMLSQLKELARATAANGVVTVRIGIGPGGNRNLIASYLQALRPWLGLSPNDTASVRKAINRTKKAIRSLQRTKAGPAGTPP